MQNHGRDRSNLNNDRVCVGRELQRQRHASGVLFGRRLVPQRPAGLVGQLDFRFQPEHLVDEDEMAGGGNGQEFCHALHEAQRDGVTRAQFGHGWRAGLGGPGG